MDYGEGDKEGNLNRKRVFELDIPNSKKEKEHPRVPFTVIGLLQRHQPVFQWVFPSEFLWSFPSQSTRGHQVSQGRLLR